MNSNGSNRGPDAMAENGPADEATNGVPDWVSNGSTSSAAETDADSAVVNQEIVVKRPPFPDGDYEALITQVALRKITPEDGKGVPKTVLRIEVQVQLSNGDFAYPSQLVNIDMSEGSRLTEWLEARFGRSVKDGDKVVPGQLVGGKVIVTLKKMLKNGRPFHQITAVRRLP